MDAINKQITEAYRRLSLQYHPDKCTVNGLTWDEANARMAKINEAYENVILEC